MSVKFDSILKSGDGRLMGVNIIPTNKTISPATQYNFTRAHSILFHEGEYTKRATVRKLCWIITGKNDDCMHCAKEKINMKEITQETTSPVTNKGETMALDISSIKHKSKVGKKFWSRVIYLCEKTKWIFFEK